MCIRHLMSHLLPLRCPCSPSADNPIVPDHPANQSPNAKRIDEGCTGVLSVAQMGPACQPNHLKWQSPPFPFWVVAGDKRVRRDRGASFALFANLNSPPRTGSINPRILHIQSMEFPYSMLCYPTCKSATRMGPVSPFSVKGDSLLS